MPLFPLNTFISLVYYHFSHMSPQLMCLFATLAMHMIYTNLSCTPIFIKITLQVLYKSRCDNRLNEITERARADKGEVCMEFWIYAFTINPIAFLWSQFRNYLKKITSYFPGRVTGEEISRKVQTSCRNSFEVNY